MKKLRICVLLSFVIVTVAASTNGPEVKQRQEEGLAGCEGTYGLCLISDGGG